MLCCLLLWTFFPVHWNCPPSFDKLFGWHKNIWAQNIFLFKFSASNIQQWHVEITAAEYFSISWLVSNKQSVMVGAAPGLRDNIFRFISWSAVKMFKVHIWSLFIRARAIHHHHIQPQFLWTTVFLFQYQAATSSLTKYQNTTINCSHNQSVLNWFGTCIPPSSHLTSVTDFKLNFSDHPLHCGMGPMVAHFHDELISRSSSGDEQTISIFHLRTELMISIWCSRSSCWSWSVHCVSPSSVTVVCKS